MGRARERSRQRTDEEGMATATPLRRECKEDTSSSQSIFFRCTLFKGLFGFYGTVALNNSRRNCLPNYYKH